MEMRRLNMLASQRQRLTKEVDILEAEVPELVRPVKFPLDLSLILKNTVGAGHPFLINGVLKLVSSFDRGR